MIEGSIYHILVDGHKEERGYWISSYAVSPGMVKHKRGTYPRTEAQELAQHSTHPQEKKLYYSMAWG